MILFCSELFRFTKTFLLFGCLLDKQILQGCHFTWKNLELDNLGKKNLENPGLSIILRCIVVKFRLETKVQSC